MHVSCTGRDMIHVSYLYNLRRNIFYPRVLYRTVWGLGVSITWLRDDALSVFYRHRVSRRRRQRVLDILYDHRGPATPNSETDPYQNIITRLFTVRSILLSLRGFFPVLDRSRKRRRRRLQLFVKHDDDVCPPRGLPHPTQGGGYRAESRLSVSSI